MGESSERAEGRGRAGLNREVLRVQRTDRPARSTGLPSVHSLRRQWETDNKLFLLALRVEARLVSWSCSCFTSLAAIIQPSGPVSMHKSPQNHGNLRSCARTPGCAKLRRVRRQTLILFAGVLITAGSSLRAGQGGTFARVPLETKLRFRLSLPGSSRRWR